jgi:hypothetical protein
MDVCGWTGWTGDALVVDCELEVEWLAPVVMDRPEKLRLKLLSEWICCSTSSMKDCEKEKRSWMFCEFDG